MKVKDLLFKTGVAAVVKASSALIAFFMTVVVTRLLGASESGLFLLAISILSFGSVFFRLGLDNVIVRLIGCSKGSSDSIGAMRTALIWSSLAAITITIFIVLVAEPLSIHLFAKPEFSSVLSTMIWAMPFMVVFMLIGFGFQAFYRVIAATFFQYLGISLFFLCLIGIIYFSGYMSDLSAAYMGYFYVFSSVVVCFIALVMWHIQVNGEWGFLRFKNTVLWNASSNLWVASTMSLMVQWSGVLIAGALVSSADVAYLTAAQRTAMLTSFVLMVVNMVVAPRYALLWNENKFNEIQRLAKWSTRGMVVLALPIVILMLVMPDFIMGLFGSEFVIAGNLLAIMAIGQFINVATGSVGFLLNMSGHERDFRKVTMFAGPLTIILSYFFIIQWGVLGAAIATAVGLSLQNIGALFMVHKRLGFWPIG
jgi:O-antigen/teichoic acid export membrane protein